MVRPERGSAPLAPVKVASVVMLIPKAKAMDTEHAAEAAVDRAGGAECGGPDLIRDHLADNPGDPEAVRIPHSC